MPADQPTTTGATTGEASWASSPPTGDAVAPGSTSLGNAEAGTTNTDGAAAAGNGATRPDAVLGLSDAQTVAVVQTANHGEIEQAHEALRKAKSARVKQFAQHVITDDSAADERLSRFDDEVGITPRASPVAERVRSNVSQTLSNLKASASDADFDSLYVGGQVTERTKVLAILDDTLLPHAQDAELVKTLHAIRAQVANHLRMAQDIETALPNASRP
jgi:putative membrane protein